MDFINITVSIFALIFSGRYLYIWSFQAENCIKANKEKRKEIRKKVFFAPQFVFFSMYDDNPNFEIWLNRIAGIVATVASVIMLSASIFGPL